MQIFTTAITNLTDARYFAAKEVDSLGFFLEEGAEHHLEPAWMKAIREWVEGPALTGWFERSTLEEVAEAVRFYALDSVVVHHNLLNGNANTDVLQGLVWHLWLPLSEADATFDTAFTVEPENWILDIGEHEASSIRDGGMERGALAEICRRRKAILYCKTWTVAQFIDLQKLALLSGICMDGGSEERVGVKSFDEMEDLFELIEDHKDN